MADNNTELLKNMLAEKVSGLLFPSETDAPITVVSFDKTPDITQTLHQASPDKGDQISETNFQDFLDKYGIPQDWQNDIQKDFARRFGNALGLMKDNLEEIKVYQLGSVRIDIYILGQFSDGSFVGLKTNSVET